MKLLEYTRHCGCDYVYNKHSQVLYMMKNCEDHVKNMHHNKLLLTVLYADSKAMNITDNVNDQIKSGLQERQIILAEMGIGDTK